MSQFTTALMETTRMLRETNPGPMPDGVRTECVTVRRQGQIPPHLGRMTPAEEDNYRAHWLSYGLLPINGFSYAAVLKDGRAVQYRVKATTFLQAYEMGRAELPR